MHPGTLPLPIAIDELNQLITQYRSQLTTGRMNLEGGFELKPEIIGSPQRGGEIHLTYVGQSFTVFHVSGNVYGFGNEREIVYFGDPVTDLQPGAKKPDTARQLAATYFLAQTGRKQGVFKAGTLEYKDTPASLSLDLTHINTALTNLSTGPDRYLTPDGRSQKYTSPGPPRKEVTLHPYRSLEGLAPQAMYTFLLTCSESAKNSVVQERLITTLLRGDLPPVATFTTLGQSCKNGTINYIRLLTDKLAAETPIEIQDFDRFNGVIEQLWGSREGMVDHLIEIGVVSRERRAAILRAVGPAAPLDQQARLLTQLYQAYVSSSYHLSCLALMDALPLETFIVPSAPFSPRVDDLPILHNWRHQLLEATPLPPPEPAPYSNRQISLLLINIYGIPLLPPITGEAPIILPADDLTKPQRVILIQLPAPDDRPVALVINGNGPERTMQYVDPTGNPLPATVRARIQPPLEPGVVIEPLFTPEHNAQCTAADSGVFLVEALRRITMGERISSMCCTTVVQAHNQAQYLRQVHLLRNHQHAQATAAARLVSQTIPEIARTPKTALEQQSQLASRFQKMLDMASSAPTKVRKGTVEAKLQEIKVMLDHLVEHFDQQYRERGPGGV